MRPCQHFSVVLYTNRHLNNALQLYGRKEFVFIIYEIIGPSSIITREQQKLREYFYLATIIDKYNFLEKAYAIDYAVIEQMRTMRCDWVKNHLKKQKKQGKYSLNYYPESSRQ